MTLVFLLMILVLNGEEESFPLPQIEYQPPRYICYRTDGAMTIDGKLDEPAWQAAPWSEDFRDIEGSNKPIPALKTKFRMLWDDHFIYVAALLEEPHVWATLKQRDSIIFHDNDFEVFIDPNGDTHEYYELEVNAFATEWDLFLVKPYRDGGTALHDWNMPGLKTAVHINGTLNDPSDTDQSWSVEIAIPLEALKPAAGTHVPPKEGDQWRFNYSRVEWQTEIVDGSYRKKINPATGKPFPENNWVWAPTGLINIHYPELWGFVRFTQTKVGQATVRPMHNPYSRAFWALRQVYYQQRLYHLKHGAYSDSPVELGLDKMGLHGYHWPPQIEVTVGSFQAHLIAGNKKSGWTINHEGKLTPIKAWK